MGATSSTNAEEPAEETAANPEVTPRDADVVGSQTATAGKASSSVEKSPAVSSPKESDLVSITRAVPAAKKKVVKKELPVWERAEEEDDLMKLKAGNIDSAADGALGKFLEPRRETSAKEPEVDRSLLEGHTDDLPLLKSYEEEVLRLSHPLQRSATGHLSAPSSPKMIVDQRHSVEELDVQDEQVGENGELAGELAEREDVFEAVSTAEATAWSCSDGLLNKHVNHATLHAEDFQCSVAMYKEPDAVYTHFEAFADIMIKSGQQAGFTFRSPSSQFYTLVRLDAVKQRVELWERSPVTAKREVLVNADNKARGFQYYRWTPLAVRGGFSSENHEVQLAAIEFRSCGAVVPLSDAVATNPAKAFLKRCGPEKLIDGQHDVADERFRSRYRVSLSGTKNELRKEVVWDYTRGAVVIEFESGPKVIDEFRLTTAADCTRLDPVRWTMHGSLDGINWTILHAQNSDYKTPIARGALTDWFTMRTWSMKAQIRTNVWHRLRVQAVGHDIAVSLDKKFVASFVDISLGSGSIGIWASNSQVRFKDLKIHDLQDFVRQRDQSVEIYRAEHLRLTAAARYKEASESRGKKATVFVQTIMRTKLRYVHQRMMKYQQSVTAGRDAKVREKTLQVWFVLLRVLAKFDTKLREPNLARDMETELLKSLAPPPLPPPASDPPSVADEDLHCRYEERKRQYEKQWVSAGLAWFGQKDFAILRDLEHGPAEKEKKVVARHCLERAMEVMDELEHQQMIRKAWCLEHDRTSIEEVDKQEVYKWAQRVSAEILESKRTGQSAIDSPEARARK